jgi:hypothetical protein
VQRVDEDAVELRTGTRQAVRQPNSSNLPECQQAGGIVSKQHLHTEVLGRQLETGGEY